MKILLLALGLLPLAFSGCNRASAQNPEATEPVPAATYKAQLGLRFSPRALQAVGVQSADVTVRDFANSPGATAVPVDAVLRTLKGDFVYVANGDWFLRTPVVLGTPAEGWWEIKAGLYEGDRIVTHGTRSVWLSELQAINGGVGCADGH